MTADFGYADQITSIVDHAYRSLAQKIDERVAEWVDRGYQFGFGLKVRRGPVEFKPDPANNVYHLIEDLHFELSPDVPVGTIVWIDVTNGGTPEEED